MATSALESKVNGDCSPGVRQKVAFITGITGQVSSLLLHVIISIVRRVPIFFLLVGSSSFVLVGV